MTELAEFEYRKHPALESCTRCIDIAKEDYEWPCGACSVNGVSESEMSYFKELK